MLIGEHKHTLDSKKRLSLPSKFRKELGKTVVITKGLDSCLFVYSVKEWKKFAESLDELSMGKSDTRAFARYFLGGAAEVDIDSAGRILIPDFLKDLAHLQTKVMVVGVNKRVELWSEESWEAYQKSLDKKADDVAEKLGDIGMI
ncbi:cell division/cell wall cluster transcriptional repressor MraZ [Candidatus Campbellbacteria bacterium]|nr:cell division/cell wall cluster transcriptional repressor MraZ [Candidatus Campbellbacteria bacterium]|tara:strand:+ start:273 stop:707 length:435 start_codon:yes stop_codon:yes gene_type:complete